MVQSADYSRKYPASSVLTLGERDRMMDSGFKNYWLAKNTGQGFIMRVDTCARLIAGFQIKNIGKGLSGRNRVTKEYKVSGSLSENGPWKTLLEDQLNDTTGNKAASLLNFTFEKPVEIQFLKFDLVSFWGAGGGLQYFAPILGTTSKQHQKVHVLLFFYQKASLKLKIQVTLLPQLKKPKSSSNHLEWGRGPTPKTKVLQHQF